MTIEIMMPFWGSVSLLKLAVESVLRQNDPDWQLTVIDDRYPGTEHTAYLASIDDSRVSVVVNPKNLGVAGNFQRAIDLATGEFLVVMGCDDLLFPDYVGRMHELISLHPGGSYFQPGVRVIDENGQPSSTLVERAKEYYRPSRRSIHELTGQALALSLLRGNWTYFPSLCWRTAEIRRWGFRPDLQVVLDLALQFDIATAGGTLVVDDVDTFFYRRHRESVSSRAAVDGSRFTEERAFFVDAAARCTLLGWSRAARAARLHLSSRFSAASRLPAAVAAGDRSGAGTLLRYLLRS
jgi:glycosyltransferase involved in cell wall biosynthesis